MNEEISLLKKLREAIDETYKSHNTIDRLIKDKIEDYYLVDEQPLPVKIGNKVVYVGNLLYDNWKIFIHDFSQVMGNLQLTITNFEILGNAEEMYKQLALNDGLEKDLSRLIKRVILNQQDYYFRELEFGGVKKIKLPKVSYRYFKKNITVEKLIQILFLIYLFNFDGVKKNLKILVDRANQSQLTQIYIYSWLQNLAGLTGKFAEDQSINYDFWHNESLQEDPIAAATNKAKENSNG